MPLSMNPEAGQCLAIGQNLAATLPHPGLCHHPQQSRGGPVPSYRTGPALLRIVRRRFLRGYGEAEKRGKSSRTTRMNRRQQLQGHGRGCLQRPLPRRQVRRVADLDGVAGPDEVNHLPGRVAATRGPRSAIPEGPTASATALQSPNHRQGPWTNAAHRHRQRQGFGQPKTTTPRSALTASRIPTAAHLARQRWPRPAPNRRADLHARIPAFR